MTEKAKITKLKNQLRQLQNDLLQKCSNVPNGRKPSELLSRWQEADCVLQRIITIENSIVKTKIKTRTCDQDWVNFVDWLHKCGVDTSKVRIEAIDTHNYGLVASTQIRQGDVILTIPHRILIQSQNASKDPKLASWVKSDPLLSSMRNVLLAIYLLNEVGRGGKSEWAPYISILPSEYTTPLYLNHEHLVRLQASPQFEGTMKLILSIMRQYAYFALHPQLSVDLPLRRIFSWTSYRWAVSTVMTRQNLVPTTVTTPAASKVLLNSIQMINNLHQESAAQREQQQSAIKCENNADGEKQRNGTGNTNSQNISKSGEEEKEEGGDLLDNALIPMWDMANHRNGKFSTDYSSETQAVICYATESVHAHQQIFIHYGQRSNGEFFLHNGFVYLENGEADSLPLRLGISPHDPLHDAKLQLCAALDLPREQFHLSPLYNQKSSESNWMLVNGQILLFLTIFHLDQKSVHDLLALSADSYEKLRIHLQDIFKSLRPKLMAFLATRCDLLLRRYPRPLLTLDSIEWDSLDIVDKLLACEIKILHSYCAATCEASETCAAST